jgi:mRNA interferase YafQ
MLKFKTTNQFEKDYKKISKRGKNLNRLHAIMQKLINEEGLQPKHRDHTLTGDFKDRRECHIEPDWLLIYKINRKERVIIFERTGSHADIFG